MEILLMIHIVTMILGEAPRSSYGVNDAVNSTYSCLTLVWTRLLPPFLVPPPMSVIFPKRSTRRSNTVDDSFVDLDPPSPTPEKRHHSPFSYLRIRKRSTEGPKKSPPPPLKDVAEPLPPVPPWLDHNRNYSDPQLIYGAQVYPQVRSPVSYSYPSNESTASRDPEAIDAARKFGTHWDAPSEDNFLSAAHAMLPAPTPMMAAAATISASQARHDGLPRSGSRHEHAGAPGLPVARNLIAAVEMDEAKVSASVGPLITVGMQNLTKAQTVLDEVVASEAWGVVKENVTAVLAPAKDVVVILDSVTKYIPAVMVAESVFSVIIKHELERHENDKNILVVYHTMTVFWFTLCDLQTIFRANKDQIKTSLDNFFQDVGKTMQDFGNFRDVYYRHGHFARTLRSSEYRTKLTGFAQAFTDHKANLQSILTQSSAMQVNDMSKTVTTVSSKIDAVTATLNQAIALIARQTPLELSVAKQVHENGGDKALQDPMFLNQIAKSSFGVEEISPQVQASLRQGLDEALAANMPMFTLKVEATQKQMSEAVERSTETILQQLNSGPYQLIKDEDIKAVWQSICKSRHFVDAVHNHFAQQFGEHRQKSGEVHPDQWTLNVLSQVIYYPTICDAIDDDGSGYISVNEVNQFFKSRPKEWSAVQWLSFWAAGWKQNALAYKARCKTLFADLEASARTVLPQNRRYVKSYIKTSGLSELWLVVNSLAADGLAHRAAHQAPETEPLAALRAEIMHQEKADIQSRLERIQYQLESPETVLAVAGTHRLEGAILCFLEIILDRHLRIIDAANTLVLAERELETMTFSLRNLVAAFGTRYHTVTQSWKQQRLDTDFLVQCFSGGIFNDWHEVFQDDPTAHNEAVESPKVADSFVTTRTAREKSPPRVENILLFPLPAQPSPRNSSQDLGSDSPPQRLAPFPVPHGPRRHSRNPHNRNSAVSDYFFHFDFERRPSENFKASKDPSSISEVYSKSKKPKLEDRITSLETELSDIKGMLSQLLVLSTPRS
ncbi:hypothetical protein B0H12DRAFT_1102177 [Mycena haematopus]|nr:hypothetical protein B0H12DRAFT_1102177 [Mycena haematopus]